jgi:molybdate transport repressor ModE-like protein
MALSPRMPELTALEVLLAIANTGSLSAAGRDVGLTQQAVSARLASLESVTGVRLVNRTTRGSQLTSAGLVVAEWADQLLEVARRIDAGLDSLRSESRTRLRVIASMTVAEQLLPRWLVSLQVAAKRHGATPPDVTFEATDSEHVIAAVRGGDADLGFIEIPGKLAGVRSLVVARDELIIVVPPDHKWARRSAPITVAELNQTDLVSRESGWRYLLGGVDPGRQADGEQRPAGERTLELSSAAAVRAAVLAGAGPAVVSRLAVREDLADGRLRASRWPALTSAAVCAQSGSAPRPHPQGRCVTC